MHTYTKHNYLSLSSFRLELGKSLETGHKLAPRQPLKSTQLSLLSSMEREDSKSLSTDEKNCSLVQSGLSPPSAVATLQTTKVFLSSSNETEEPGLKELSRVVNCRISPTPRVRGQGAKHRGKS